MKTNREQIILDMIDMIEDNQRDFGVYSGGSESARAIAHTWAEEGFTADEVQAWIDAGVWAPAVARKLDLRGIKPRELEELCATVKGFRDPIYSLNSGDLSVEGLFED